MEFPKEVLKIGDTVRLAASIMQADFSLALCNNDGEILEIDRVVAKAWP
ncbi:hypothetical protein [Synechococcus sp. M16CYN]